MTLHETWSFEPDGTLARSLVPRRGKPYTHRCALSTYEAVLAAIEERPGVLFVLDDLVAWTALPSTQVHVALAFLHEYGLVERVHGRKTMATTDELWLDGHVAWHGLREGGVRWLRAVAEGA